MYLAIVQCDGDCRARLQDREMSWPAKDDISAFGQIDFCLTGSKRKIAPAGKQGGSAPVLILEADRSTHGNIVSREASDHLLPSRRPGQGRLLRPNLRMKDQKAYEAERAPENCALEIFALSLVTEFVYAHLRPSHAYNIADHRVRQVTA